MDNYRMKYLCFVLPICRNYENPRDTEDYRREYAGYRIAFTYKVLKMKWLDDPNIFIKREVSY